MSRSLREVLSAGAAPSVQAATTTGLELIRVAAEAPPLRDPVELNIDDQGVLSRSGAAAPAGVGVYAAPEVEQNPDAEAARVYFVCAVLYHQLSGRAPYPDVGSDALAVRKALEPVAPLGETAPAALGALILAGLRADPAARPSLAQLGAVLRAPPTLSAPSPAPMPAAMRAAMPAPMAAAPGGPGFSGSVPPVDGPRLRSLRPLPVALGCLTMLAVAGIAAVALLSVSREAPAPEPMATTAAPSQAVSDTAPPQAEAPASRRATEEREEAKKADDEAPAAPAMDGFGAPAAEAPAPAAPAPAAEAPAARASASRPAASGGAPNPRPSPNPRTSLPNPRPRPRPSEALRPRPRPVERPRRSSPLRLPSARPPLRRCPDAAPLPRSGR